MRGEYFDLSEYVERASDSMDSMDLPCAMALADELESPPDDFADFPAPIVAEELDSAPDDLADFPAPIASLLSLLSSLVY